MYRHCNTLLLLLTPPLGVISAPPEPPQGNFKGYPIPRTQNDAGGQEPHLTVIPPPSSQWEQQGGQVQDTEETRPPPAYVPQTEYSQQPHNWSGARRTSSYEKPRISREFNGTNSYSFNFQTTEDNIQYTVRPPRPSQWVQQRNPAQAPDQRNRNFLPTRSPSENVPQYPQQGNRAQAPDQRNRNFPPTISPSEDVPQYPQQGNPAQALDQRNSNFPPTRSPSENVPQNPQQGNPAQAPDQRNRNFSPTTSPSENVPQYPQQGNPAQAPIQRNINFPPTENVPQYPRQIHNWPRVRTASIDETQRNNRGFNIANSHIFNFQTTDDNTQFTPKYQPPKINAVRRTPRFHWAHLTTKYKKEQDSNCNSKIAYNSLTNIHDQVRDTLYPLDGQQAATDTCSWTDWQNTDRPTGRCDCESLPLACQTGQVEDYQIKTGTGQVLHSVETVRRLNGQVLSFTKEQGVACWNKDQTESHCQDWMFMDQFQGGPPCCDDYSVRYCCTGGGAQVVLTERVAVKMFIHLETIVQKVILYPVLKMLMIIVPPHANWEGVTVMMDQTKGQQVVKAEDRCMFSDLPRESKDIFTTFNLFKEMSSKTHNISAGGDQALEAVASVIREEFEMPGHHLESENSIIQKMCSGTRLYKVEAQEVSQDEMKKLDDGKMVAVSAPVTNMRTQAGCTSSVTVMTRVTGTHCWYTYHYPDPVTGLSLTFQHQGMATKAVDCCVFGTAPLLPPGPPCWCGQSNANTMTDCGAKEIPTLTECGSRTSTPMTHIENWSTALLAWSPAPPECSFTVQKVLPGQICNLVLDFEVLSLGQEEACQTGIGQVRVTIGQTQAAVCGQASREETGQVRLAGGQENPLVVPWPADVDTATIMVESGKQGWRTQKWAFKAVQNC